MQCTPAHPGNKYDLALKAIKDTRHSQCVFQHNAPVDSLHFFFSDDGTLMGEFQCSAEHQGHDGIVHGGIISAIIDASSD